MPELPEVENVRQSLEQMGLLSQEFLEVELHREGLRVAFPPRLDEELRGQKIVALGRRAKYLIFETNDFVLLSHLGMTGSWRSSGEESSRKHDHVTLHFKSGLSLIFNDPRRFGILDLIEKTKVSESRWLRHLGVEPLDQAFTGTYLFQKTRRLKSPIKAFLMDQRRVVGVGNIYASEALFAAQVRPTRQAGKITKLEAERLAEHIRRILVTAIAAGGSTIRDYRNSKGESGSFQDQHQVYDREASPCRVCGNPIRAKFLLGRSTYWCSGCQR